MVIALALLFAAAEFGVPVPVTTASVTVAEGASASPLGLSPGRVVIEPLALTEADIPPAPPVLEPEPPRHEIDYATGWVTHPDGTVLCVMGAPCDTPALGYDPTRYTYNWETGDTP